MMHISSALFLDGLVGFSLVMVALVAAGFSWYWSWRMHRRLDALHGDISAHGQRIEGLALKLTNVASVADRMLLDYEQLIRDVDQIAQRQSHQEARGGGGPSYERAIDMVEQGMDPDELIKHLGLNQGEADLVAQMHGRRKIG